MKECLDFAKSFAYEAGAVIKKNFALKMAKEWKEDGSPVTETDKHINDLLIKEVNERFPEHSVKGEEASSAKDGAEYIWLCDPVDGTIPFSHGIPICTFSLALVKNGESILGVTYDPFSDRLFEATKGGGAFLNGEPIHVNTVDTLAGAHGEFTAWASAPYDLLPIATHIIMEEKSNLLKLSSSVYPASLVAAGEFTFTLFGGCTAHDIAAVKVIVEEAGGKVTNLFGEEQRYDQDITGAIVSNGIVHEKLVALAKGLVKEK